MRVLGERSMEHNQDIFICFVDLMKYLRQATRYSGNNRSDWRDRGLIKSLSMHQNITVCVEDGESDLGWWEEE